mmetsp:Transcript_2787/g.3117  ORF Transcript_2787/g.3117 Transcript_2787/m.3117 type:complete len:143 (+) Transcript_2787:48-476(+)
MANCRRSTSGLKPSRMAFIPDNLILPEISYRQMQQMPTDNQTRNEPRVNKPNKIETNYSSTNNINPVEHDPVDFAKQQSNFSPIIIADDEQITRELNGLSSLVEVGFITPSEYNKRRKCLLLTQKLTCERLYMVFQPRWEWV